MTVHGSHVDHIVESYVEGQMLGDETGFLEAVVGTVDRYRNDGDLGLGGQLETSVMELAKLIVRPLGSGAFGEDDHAEALLQILNPLRNGFERRADVAPVDIEAADPADPICKVRHLLDLRLGDVAALEGHTVHERQHIGETLVVGYEDHRPVLRQLLSPGHVYGPVKLIQDPLSPFTGHILDQSLLSFYISFFSRGVDLPGGSVGPKHVACQEKRPRYVSYYLHCKPFIQNIYTFNYKQLYAGLSSKKLSARLSLVRVEIQSKIVEAFHGAVELHQLVPCQAQMTFHGRIGDLHGRHVLQGAVPG